MLHTNNVHTYSCGGIYCSAHLLLSLIPPDWCCCCVLLCRLSSFFLLFFFNIVDERRMNFFIAFFFCCCPGLAQQPKILRAYWICLINSGGLRYGYYSMRIASHCLSPSSTIMCHNLGLFIIIIICLIICGCQCGTLGDCTHTHTRIISVREIFSWRASPQTWCLVWICVAASRLYWLLSNCWIYEIAFYRHVLFFHLYQRVQWIVLTISHTFTFILRQLIAIPIICLV